MREKKKEAATISPTPKEADRFWVDGKNTFERGPPFFLGRCRVNELPNRFLPTNKGASKKGPLLSRQSQLVGISMRVTTVKGQQRLLIDVVTRHFDAKTKGKETL